MAAKYTKPRIASSGQSPDAGLSKCIASHLEMESIPWIESAGSDYYDKLDGRQGLAYWNVLRFSSPDEAKHYMDATMQMIQSCEIESKTDPRIYKIASFSSTINGAMAAQTGTEMDADRQLWIRRGSLVFGVMSRISQERADLMMRLQEDKIESIR
ncbi:hypothetical protein [Arthrobacter sp. KNU40]|uniref:hypothetical protein n=1 Tax=Arthrobacter sp. KNU40 TaxID=3447965 RepID=UPI003F62CDEF